VFRVRRQQGQASLFEQSRSQPKIGDDWTVWGLSRFLGVDRDWLYRRIYTGRLPTTRHPATGHCLITDHPVLMASLQAQVAAQQQRV
jgi:hypothetical protein